MIGGIPGAGATMRTVVNIKSGGSSKLSGVIHGVLLLLILVGLGKYASLIPLPVLAGILITVGIGIVDYKGLKHIASVPRADAAIMLIVLGMTVFVDLLQAVAVGMVFARVLFMKKMSDLVENTSELVSIKQFDDEGSWSDESIIPAELANKIYIKHFEGPLFFGFANAFQSMLRALPDVKIVILRMLKVPYIDQTGLYAVEDAVLAMHEKNITVLITGIQPQPLDMLKKVSLVLDVIPEARIFKDFPSCVKQLEAGIIDTEATGKPRGKIDFSDILKWIK